MSRRIATTLSLAAVAALAAAGSASAATLKGTVVHRSSNSHSFVVADAHGAMTAIHASRTPGVGRKVVVRARQLRNGTFAATSIRRGARVHRARVRGVVTYVDHRKGAFVVSARGVSLVVRNRRATARAAAATDPSTTLPDPGTTVTVTTTVDDQGDLENEGVQDQGQTTEPTDLEGKILSIDTAARTLTLSADDNEDLAGASVVVHLPDTFDMTAFQVGDQVEIKATLQPDGSYLAVGSSQDANKQEADSSGDDQGDNSQSGDNNGADDHGADNGTQQQGDDDAKTGTTAPTTSTSSGTSGDANSGSGSTSGGSGDGGGSGSGSDG